MLGMSSAQTVTHFERELEKISVRVMGDPPGRIETAPQNRPRIAVHLGSSVQMFCQRAGQKHRGLAVHGDIDIVPAGTACIWEPNGPDQALVVGVDPDLLAATAADLGLNGDRLEIVNRFQVRDPQIEHICWALKAEMEAGYPMGRTFLNSLSDALAIALVRRHSCFAPVPFSMHTRMTGHRLRQAVSYIEDNLKQELSLSDIAGAAGISVSHLKTTFRQFTGVPVHRYVIQRRVQRAAILLGEGKLSITRVAQEAGFAHQSHLAKHMRRILGFSPKQVRASIVKDRSAEEDL